MAHDRGPGSQWQSQIIPEAPSHRKGRVYPAVSRPSLRLEPASAAPAASPSPTATPPARALRPREKLCARGVAALTEAELL
ncbi:MAG: hypothetical protein AAB113_04415, partial [Candidatus Eisenbacteria bacterium]